MSAQIDIKGHVSLDTSSVKSGLDDITKQTQQQPLYTNSSSSEAIQGNILNNPSFSDSSQKMLVGEFEKSLPTIIYNFQQLSKSLADLKDDVPKVRRTIKDYDKSQEQIDKTREQLLVGLFNNGNSLSSNIIHGNMGGAVSGAFSNTADSVSKIQDLAKNNGMDAFAGILGKAIPGLLIGGAIVKGATAFSDKYASNESIINQSGKSFNFDGSSQENFDIYKRLNNYNVGTGLDNAEFNQYVQALAKQGVKNIDSAGVNAQSALKWAYATNGDENQYINLAGKMMRYGGSKDIGNDFSYLYGAAKASGLEDSQMGEFLMGIEKVMEDGIAKGFTRSSKEVADTMVMFSRLSNNDQFWAGERGAQRLNQINNGIAGATALAKTSDVMVLQAFSSAFDTQAQKTILEGDYIQDGGYLNDMMLMERGLKDGKVFNSLMKTLNDRTGGDIQAKAEYLRDITGMNYTGVSKLLKLEGKGLSESELQSEIEKLQKDPKNQNLETRNQESLNRIAETAEEIGMGVKGLSTAALEPISQGVDAIKNFLLGDENEENVLPEYQQKYDMKTQPLYYNREKLDVEQTPRITSYDGKQKLTDYLLQNYEEALQDIADNKGVDLSQLQRYLQAEILFPKKNGEDSELYTRLRAQVEDGYLYPTERSQMVEYLKILIDTVKNMEIIERK